jgi:acyl-CoA synthetase (AMP-forming)/AMP-acid ligase II
MGFQTGDMLAVSLYNCPEFHLVLLGTMEAGMVVTTVNPEYTPGADVYCVLALECDYVTMSIVIWLELIALYL